jgi:hypothetical protein
VLLVHTDLHLVSITSHLSHKHLHKNLLLFTVAEIAAAQMLVGVAEGDFSPNPILKHANNNNIHSLADNTFHFPTDTEDDAFLAEVFGVHDENNPTDDPSVTDLDRSASGGGMDTAANAAAGLPNSMGNSLNLQIVNPDALMEPNLEEGGYFKRRCVNNGQASPSTPWDGQLEALVR